MSTLCYNVLFHLIIYIIFSYFVKGLKGGVAFEVAMNDDNAKSLIRKHPPKRLKVKYIKMPVLFS